MQERTLMVAYINYARRQCSPMGSCYSQTNRGANLAQCTPRFLRVRPSCTSLAHRQGVCRQTTAKHLNQDAAHDCSNAHSLNLGGGRWRSRPAGRTRRGPSNFAPESLPKGGNDQRHQPLPRAAAGAEATRQHPGPWFIELADGPQSVELGATTEAARKNTAFGSLPKIELAKLSVN